VNQVEHTKATIALYRVNMLFVKLEEIFLGLAFFVLLGVMIIQVSCRYVFMYPTPWAEELCRYVFIWIGYIGGAYATFYWDHIEIDLVVSLIKKFSKNPERTKLIVDKIAVALSVGFLIVFLKIYAEFFSQVSAIGQQSAAMGINMMLPMFSAYIGSILMIFHGLSIMYLPKSIIKPACWK
jgi:TRAP-type C4-dicarboxylate transport system permease small subunit